MELTGKQREQLKDALISAFPDKNKLEQMLDYKLDKKLNAIAGGSNLTDIVSDLIKTAESEGWVEKLIDGASKQNSGNQKLQTFIEQHIPIPSLFEILAPVAKDFISDMQQAYLDCCSDSLRKAYEEDGEEKPNSLITVLNAVKNLDERRTRRIEGKYYSADIQFVARLFNLLKEKKSQKTVNQLKDWGEKSGENFIDLLNELKNQHRISRMVQNPPLHTYILIQLKKSQQYKKQYLVSAWFIPDGCNSKRMFEKSAIE